MYPTTSYPNGFANGIAIRGMPLVQTQQGAIYFLSNSAVYPRESRAGSDSNRGTFNSPFATLQGALGQCKAGEGDVIFVGPGHAENISSATALNLNVSGVAIIGLGTGTLRPTFTLDTATTSTITVSAANISIQHCIFKANFANIAALFTLTTAQEFSVDSCMIQDTSAILNFLSLFATDATANHADGLSITNNLINLKATSGVVNLLLGGAAADRVLVMGISYLAVTTNAGAIIAMGAFGLTNFRMLHNYFNIQNAAATATGIWVVAGAGSGFVDDNYGFALSYPSSAAPLLCTAAAAFAFGLNETTHTAGASGLTNPTAAA
jgi:hypothetical protein